MLKAGRIQTLTVTRVSEYGLYLADEEQNEVLLPNRYTSLTDKVGDRKEVFLYHDSEDRLVATTETPLLREGEAGYLRVVDKTAHGAFLDWGLHGKDLFLPTPDKKFIYNITRSFYHGLVKHGVRVYEWTPGFSHAKMIVTDQYQIG